MNMIYGAASISILKNLEAVRKRPGMYAGDCSSVAATHHLLYEIFDNAIDEALAGHANRVDVALHADGSASVRDNGRGIPVDIHPTEGISAAEVIFTTLHAGGKFDSDSYEYSGGLHGVGAAVTNALSDWLTIEVRRDGAVWEGRFEDSETAQPITELRPLKKGEETGTFVRFRPSSRFLKVVEFERDTLLARFREVAYLNAGITITLTDERVEAGAEPFRETCLFQDGMADFVRAIVEDSDMAVPIARFAGAHEGVQVDVAFTWMVEDRPEDIRAYTNNIPQPDGGQHVTGLRAAITKTLMTYAEREKLVKRGSRLGPDDLREGLACALLVRVPDPAFSSQTKEKLISTEARTAVEAVVGQSFGIWLDTHPEESRLIISRALAAAEARIAAKKARELSRSSKPGKRVSSINLPEKLADCSSRDHSAREIFLVEGDSAGGSAKAGRDREIQAILPLRGKILNVERAKQSAILKNAEIAGMIQTFGAGFGDKMDLDRLRYGKIIVMTDADVDGSHIATLILTFFFRQMRPLVEAGHLYLAVPPLYRVRRKGEEDIFVRSEADLTGLFLDRALADRQLSLGGETMQGVALSGSLRRLIDTAPHLAAAARILKGPELADAILGAKEAGALLGETRITEKAQKGLIKALTERLSRSDPTARWSLDIVGDGLGYGLSAVRYEDGLDTDHSLSRAELTSWQVLRVREDFEATGLMGEPIEVSGKPVHGPIGFMEAMRRAGARAAQVSRYKGLGEMNSDELWETTMDPARRTLHRVRIEDAEAAEAMFSGLMAENVSTRRSIIEEMCAGAINLDI